MTATASPFDWRAHAPYWLLIGGAVSLNVLCGTPAMLGQVRDILPDAALTLPFAIAFALLWLGYVGVAKLEAGPAAHLVAVYCGALVAVFLLTPAALSIDLLDYIRRGRILSVHGANPHITAATSFPDDAFYGGAGWTFLATPYGPAFTLLSAALTWIADDSPLANILAFKLTMTAAHLLNFALVRRITGSARAGLVYLCNPFVLLEGVANAHNDVLAATAVLASLRWTQTRSDGLSAASLAVAAWIKIPFAALLPLWARYAWAADAKTARRRIGLGTAAVVAVTMALWAPFYAGLTVFHVYRVHAGLMTKWSVPALLRDLLASVGGVHSATLASIACAAIAALLALPAIWRARRGPLYLRAIAVVLLLLPLVALGWLLPWYFIWPASVLPLLPGSVWRNALLALTAAGFAHYVQQSYLAFDSSFAENLVLGMTSIAPPFAVLAIHWLRTRRPAGSR